MSLTPSRRSVPSSNTINNRNAHTNDTPNTNNTKCSTMNSSSSSSSSKTFCSRTARLCERSHPNVAQNDVYAHGGPAPHRAVLCPRGGLVKLVDVDAERMLRTAEGLARSSVTRVEFVNRASVAANSSAEAKEKVEPCQGGAAPSATPSGRGKKSKKKKGGSSGDGRGREQRWRRGTSFGRWC